MNWWILSINLTSNSPNTSLRFVCVVFLPNNKKILSRWRTATHAHIQTHVARIHWKFHFGYACDNYVVTLSLSLSIRCICVRLCSEVCMATLVRCKLYLRISECARMYVWFEWWIKFQSWYFLYVRTRQWRRERETIELTRTYRRDINKEQPERIVSTASRINIVTAKLCAFCNAT